MKIGVVGAGGRMGQMVVREIAGSEQAELAGGAEAPGNPAVGADVAGLAGLGDCGLVIDDDAGVLFARAAAVIDFTVPAATALHAGLAAQHGTILITGTTGLDDAQQGAVAAAGQKTAIVQAPNMSLGVNLLFALTRKVAAILGDDFDIEIIEMHHRRKVDAPSGTALGLGRAAADGRGVDLDDVAQRVRDGHTGARRAGDIGFASLRGGDVVGDHTVIFAGESERLELTHKAASRAIFARGAVRAALWAEGKPPGLYDMADVLGLE